MADGLTDSLGLSPFVVALRTCFILILAMLIIAGNILSIAVTRRVTNLADSTKVLMMTMAASDLLVGVQSLLSTVASALDRWPFGTTGCALATYSLNVTLTMSIFSLSCLNIDRYIAIARPYRFPVWCTKRRAVILVLILWILSVCTSIASELYGVRVKYYAASAICFFGNNPDAINMAALLIFDIIPVLVIMSVYFRIIQISRRHELRNNPHIDGNNGREHKALKTFLVVTVTFAACYTPLTLMKTLEGLANLTTPNWLEFLTMWVAVSNSAFNVFIYCLFNLAYRQTAKRIIRHRFPCCTVSAVEPVTI